MTVDNHEEIETALTYIAEQDLGSWDRDFVEDQIARFRKWGPYVVVSARQMEQINRLKDKYPMNSSSIGHNSGETPPETASVGGVAGDRLKSFIERIERLEEEKTALAEDIREVYSEAKSTGFDVKVMRKIIQLRKMDASDRSEMEELIDVYKRALMME